MGGKRHVPWQNKARENKLRMLDRSRTTDAQRRAQALLGELRQLLGREGGRDLRQDNHTSQDEERYQLDQRDERSRRLAGDVAAYELRYVLGQDGDPGEHDLRRISGERGGHDRRVIDDGVADQRQRLPHPSDRDDSLGAQRRAQALLGELRQLLGREDGRVLRTVCDVLDLVMSLSGNGHFVGSGIVQEPQGLLEVNECDEFAHLLVTPPNLSLNDQVAVVLGEPPLVPSESNTGFDPTPQEANAMVFERNAVVNAQSELENTGVADNACGGDDCNPYNADGRGGSTSIDHDADCTTTGSLLVNGVSSSTLRNCALSRRCLTDFRCKTCSKQFETRSRRDNHVRIEHQSTCVLALSDGKSETCNRREDGTFSCPENGCDFSHKSAKNLKRHHEVCVTRHHHKNSLRPASQSYLIIPPNASSNDQIATNNFRIVRLENMTLITCSQCNSAVYPDRGGIKSHIARCIRNTGSKKRQSKLTVSLSDVDKVLQSASSFEILKSSSYMVPTSELLQPVPGIRIYSGFSCRRCIYYSSKQSTIEKHRRLNHRQSSYRETVDPCSVQSLFKSVHRRWVGVDNSSVDRTSGEIVQAISRAITSAIEASNAHFDSGKHVVRLSAWLRRSEWDRDVASMIPEGSSLDGVQKAIAIEVDANEPPHFHCLPKLATVYMEKLQDTIMSIHYVYRRIVVSSDAKLEHIGLNTLQEFSTRQRYSALMTRLVLALLRSHLELEQCVHVIRSNNESLTISLGRLDNYLRGVDADALENELPLEGVKRLHDVLLALAVPPNQSDNVNVSRGTECVQLRFLRLVSLKFHDGHYSFVDARHVGPKIAVMNYWVRGAILMAIGQKLWDPFAENMTEDRLQYLTQFTREGITNSPVVQLQQTMRLAASVAANEPVKPQLIVLSCGTGCSIGGEDVYLAAFQQMIQQLIAKAHRIMAIDVLISMNTNWIEEALSGTIFDDLNCWDEGYSFVWNPRNVFVSHQRDFFNVVLDSRRPRSVSTGIDNTGKILFDQKLLKAWQNAAAQIHDLLWLLLHFCAGQPPRGEEYRSYLLRNTATGVRSFYYCEGRIMTFQVYHKGSNLAATPVKLIPRFLPRQLTRLFIEYFLFVRPFQNFVAQQEHDPKVAAQIQTIWAAEMQNIYTGNYLSGLITMAFAEHCLVNITMRQYRHVAAFFSGLLRQHDSALPFEEAAGHSRKTEEHSYAQDKHDLRFIDSGMMHKFLLVARYWHTLVGFVEKTNSKPNEKSDDRLEEPSEEKTAPQVPVICHNRSLVNSAPSSNQVLSASTCQTVTEREAQNLTTPDIAYCLAAKEALHRLKHLKWRSFAQSIAVSRALEGVTDFIAVFPTGYGKSLLFLAPAVMYSMQSVVLIVPLALLIKNHLIKCKELDVTSEKWSASMTIAGAPSVIFVSAESACEDEFLQFTKGLAAWDRLFAIFFDEIHLVLEEYRAKMKNLFALTTIGVPFIGMTATLSPQQFVEVRNMLSTPFGIVRVDTSRPNIEYKVMNVSSISKALVGVIKSSSVNPHILVYVMTTAEVEIVTSLLKASDISAASLYASMHDDEKEAQLGGWLKGSNRVMVSTGVLGCGFDLASVRLVIHYGSIHSLFHFHQESGRGGRNGQPARSIVISNEYYRAAIVEKFGNEERRRVAHFWISQRKECRRKLLHSTVDGSQDINCFVLPNAQLCDICLARHMIAQHKSRDTNEGVVNSSSTDMIVARAQTNNRTEIQSLQDLQDIRRFNPGEFCIACYVRTNGGSKVTHSRSDCRFWRSGMLCFKCLGHHVSVRCPNKFVSHSTCYRCHFQTALTIRGNPVHMGPYGHHCKDASGESLRWMIWLCWRDEKINQKMFASCKFLGDRIAGPQSEGSFAKKLMDVEPGQLLNNFTRVAASMIRCFEGR